MAEPGNFGEHVLQASLPVLKICLLGSVGALLAACGVLDQQGRRTLSKLIYFLFTPALTFSKLAPVLTAQHLLQWMPLAVNMFVSVGVGLVLGVLLLLVVGAPPWFRRHVVVATGLGNAGNLPLVLVAALLRESGGVIFKEQDVSADLAIAYVAMGIWAATLTHFTVGTHLLKMPGRQSSSSSSGGADIALAEQAADGTFKQQQQDYEKAGNSWKGYANQHGSTGEGCNDSSRQSVCDGASFCSVELTTPSAVKQQQQILLQKQQEAAAGPGYDIYEDSSSGVAAPQLQQQQHQRVPSGSSRWQALSAWVVTFLQKSAFIRGQQQGYGDLEHAEGLRLLSKGASHVSSSSSDSQIEDSIDSNVVIISVPEDPQQQQQHRFASSSSNSGAPGTRSRWLRIRSWCCSVAASIGSVLWAQASPPMVGCVLAVVVGMTAAVRDELFAPGGHLHLIQDCLDMFSDCCIPCLLLMMGATLAKGPGKACPPWRVVVGVSAARLVLLPLLGTAWILLAHKTGWLVAPDSMFLLVMLIQNSVPTALNVHTLATLHANREEEVAALLFWQYLAACLTVPSALMLYLWVLKTPALSIRP